MSSESNKEDLIYQLNAQLLQSYKNEEAFWRQRSRQLWLTPGDANTAYFHAVTKGRKTKNRMAVMEDDSGVPWFEEDQIASVICKYYNFLFSSSQNDGQHTVWEALQPCITQQINENLIRDPCPEEIREATFAIHPDKAPGPDGFSASFFQANWSVVGPAIIKEVQLFFTT